MSTTQLPCHVESTADHSKMIVLLTIHGIGFQVSPVDAPEGYADPLHKALSLPGNLGADLSSDPNTSDRGPTTPRDGAVYVQSHWPPTSEDAERGLARLGAKLPLRMGTERFAHVALVYSHLEESKPKPLSLLELCGQAAFQWRKYGTFRQLIRWVWRFGTVLRNPGERQVVLVSPKAPPAPQAPTPSLMPRRSIKRGRSRTPGVPSTMVAIENDFAAYVLRNDLRERVRGFVREAIIRLAERQDVEAIVINSHSQGTLAAYDVMAGLPPQAIDKIGHVVTSGSHLRKLVKLFNWGSNIGNIPIDVPWTNFLDLRDPVADGLCPERWIPGTYRDCPSDQRTLFSKETSAGVGVLHRPVNDVVVDNVAHSPGAIRAHNYFDNTVDFVPKLAEIVCGAGVRQPTGATVP